MKMTKKKTPLLRNVGDVPFTAKNETVHMGITFGDVAPRILTVGSHKRALRIARMFDRFPEPRMKRSTRGFTVITGKYGGIEVSVVAIGMGMPMMDFFIRECRAVVTGPMLIVRFGTCGCLDPTVPPGSVVIASEGSAYVVQDYAAFASNPDEKLPYAVHSPVPADRPLSGQLALSLNEEFSNANFNLDSRILEGLNVTADSYYSSQGRTDPSFLDYNAGLLQHVREQLPTALTMEMMTFGLFHLAQRSVGHSIRAAAAHIVLANRATGAVIDEQQYARLEIVGGGAMLSALVATPLATPDLIDLTMESKL